MRPGFVATSPADCDDDFLAILIDRRDKGSEPFVRPFRPTAPGLADLTVQLALNLRLQGIVAQRRARLARGSNIGQPIRIDRGIKQGRVAIVALRPCSAQGLG